MPTQGHDADLWAAYTSGQSSIGHLRARLLIKRLDVNVRIDDISFAPTSRVTAQSINIDKLIIMRQLYCRAFLIYTNFVLSCTTSIR